MGTDGVMCLPLDRGAHLRVLLKFILPVSIKAEGLGEANITWIKELPRNRTSPGAVSWGRYGWCRLKGVGVGWSYIFYPRGAELKTVMCFSPLIGHHLR